MLTICDLYDRWCGKSLVRLLTLLLAFAVAAPMLLAEDRDHDKDHGRFVDPIVGSWIRLRQSRGILGRWHHYQFRS
jgi:hypothetical protein